MTSDAWWHAWINGFSVGTFVMALAVAIFYLGWMARDRA